MSILINKHTRVITQGITGKTGRFHTQTSRDYANGKKCYVAGVNPKRAGENFEGIPIYGAVAEAKGRELAYKPVGPTKVERCATLQQTHDKFVRMGR